MTNLKGYTRSEELSVTREGGGCDVGSLVMTDGFVVVQAKSRSLASPKRRCEG